MRDLAYEALGERMRGHYDLAIATSIAIECLLGTAPELDANGDPNPFYSDKPPPIKDFSQVWVNVDTLLRNLIGSVPTEAAKELTPDALVDGLQSEILVLEGVIADHTNNLVNTFFYKCDYSKLDKRFPKATIKVPKTDKQVFQHNLHLKVLENINCLSFDSKITKGGERAVILTHHPLDLLSKSNFTSLSLLESHTGKVKKPIQWNSKLQKSSVDVSNIPFNNFTLQIFGDGVDFNGQLPNIKKLIASLAETAKWSPLTTLEKITFNLKRLPPDPLTTDLLEMAKSK